MTYSLSIGGSRAIADARRKRFRLLYGFNLALQTGIAVVALVSPYWIGRQVGMEISGELMAGWIRVWGAMLVMASLFQLPGYRDPIGARLCIMIGLIGRALMVALFLMLGGAFLWLALFDGAFALLILLAFQSLIKAEIMTRP